MMTSHVVIRVMTSSPELMTSRDINLTYFDVTLTVFNAAQTKFEMEVELTKFCPEDIF